MADWVRYIAFDLWSELGDPVAESKFNLEFSTNIVAQLIYKELYIFNMYIRRTICEYVDINDNASSFLIEYFWLGGPWLTWSATIAYLWIVLKAGPEFMRHRGPYDMKLAIRLYNLLLVVINAYLFIGTINSFRYGLDFWGCAEALSLEKRDVLLHYGHLFFHTRYLEFFDTFFFVLRKKQSQITFLHVFHHGVVPTLMYIGLKFYPVPFNVLLPTTNMFVHIIMYAYYGLATFGPSIQKYLWWKRYLTTLQISQFALLLIHCSQPLLFIMSPECKFPLGLVIINSCIGMTFLSLFLSFYRSTYGKPSLRQKSKHESTMNGVKHNGDITNDISKVNCIRDEISTNIKKVL